MCTHMYVHVCVESQRLYRPGALFYPTKSVEPAWSYFLSGSNTVSKLCKSYIIKSSLAGSQRARYSSARRHCCQRPAGCRVAPVLGGWLLQAADPDALKLTYS